MKIEVTMTERGGITIPAALRKLFGLNGNNRLIVEDTAEGLLLRPAVSVPIETYSEERIAEFAQDEESLGRYFEDKTGDNTDRKLTPR
jgi:AbrB family looped-hinge helix DNA binding protein